MSKVFPSKYEAEIVTVRWNFADVLPFGVLPVSAVVTASLQTGNDPLPAEFLLGSATIDGTVVAQQLQHGYPGDVYILTCSVVDGSSYTHVKVSYQAVLSNTDSFYAPAPMLELLGDLPDGYIGYPYYDMLLINGGTPPYVNPRIISGAMPAWMSADIVDEWLIFSGNPNVLGVSTFTPDITDFAGRHASNPQQIEILPNPPTITVAGSLPDGYVGGAWAGGIYVASGGTPPYTYVSLPGTYYPGNLGPMNSAGVVSPEIATTEGPGFNAVRATDALGREGTAVSSFTILPPPRVLMIDTAATYPFVSLDGITWTLAANNISPGSRGLSILNNGRTSGRHEYTDDLAATPWVSNSLTVFKSYDLTRRGDTVVWGASGPFDKVVRSFDNGVTGTNGDATTNGIYSVVYVGSTIIGLGATNFVQSINDGASFTATNLPSPPVAHGFNMNNTSHACLQYSGGACFIGSNAGITRVRVVFTSDGVSFTGGDITTPTNSFTSVGSDATRSCLGYVDGDETIVILPYTGSGIGSPDFLYTRDLGNTWLIGTNPLGSGKTLQIIGWNGFCWILGGSEASIAYLSYSFDLITWTPCTYPVGAQEFYGISKATVWLSD